MTFALLRIDSVGPLKRLSRTRFPSAFASSAARSGEGTPSTAKRLTDLSTASDMGWRFSVSIPGNAPLIVVEAVWQYSHHVLAGLFSHKGPILTVANWSGQWPGLVGMLNLNGSLTKAGVKYSTLWSADFTDDFFRDGSARWLDGRHDQSRYQPRASA